MTDSTAKPPWAVLLKFGLREHLEQFRRDGLLHANHLDYFSKLEADRVRSDRFEGSEQIHQPKDITRITFSGPGIEKDIVVTPSDLAGPLIVSSGKVTNCNVYCMYSITRPIKKGGIDPRNFGFGDSFVIVLNTQAFLDRIAAAVRKKRINCEWRSVEYYDADEYSGETGPFRKPDRFAFQKEFRFAFRPASAEPLRLSIGDLSDITTPIHPLAEINELVEFDLDSARKAGLVDA